MRAFLGAFCEQKNKERARNERVSDYMDNKKKCDLITKTGDRKYLIGVIENWTHNLVRIKMDNYHPSSKDPEKVRLRKIYDAEIEKCRRIIKELKSCQT